MTASPPTSDRADAYFAVVVATRPATFRMWVAASESEFYSAAEDLLHEAISKMEAGARHYHGQSERLLSFTLAQIMSSQWVNVTPEAFHNGHADIVINHPCNPAMVMLGECKIYRGYEYHCDGCDQLLNRYSSGRSARGFCLDFFQTRDMYGKMTELRADFDLNRPFRQVGESSGHRIVGAFVTAHVHFTSATVEVLHVGCNTYHLDARPQPPADTVPK